MKIIYAGNRSFALKNFGKKFKNEISIFAIKNSFLEKYAETNSYKLETFSSKQEIYDLLKKIKNKTLFISCGVPFKIDIDKFPLIAFLNIHPSLLPFLKGRDPGIGLLLKGGKLGVTVHQMNMDIDSGFILWQSDPIVIDEIMNIKDIYSLSFLLEEKAGDEIASQILINGIEDFIEKFLKTLKIKSLSTQEGSYFNRSIDYGFYKESFSNEYLINHVRSASLKNYGTRAKLIGKSFEIEVIIDSCYLVKENISQLLLLFEQTNKSKLEDNTLLYILETRIAVFRESQILILDIKDKITKQYQFDKNNKIQLKEYI